MEKDSNNRVVRVSIWHDHGNGEVVNSERTGSFSDEDAGDPAIVASVVADCVLSIMPFRSWRKEFHNEFCSIMNEHMKNDV